MGLIGILLGLTLLIFFAYRGWSVLLLTPLAALLAAALSGEPLLANWTQTFMGGVARFIASFFPIFLLGALFGKLMEDSGSVQSVANYVGAKLGAKRAILAVVLAGAAVTYGGVSLFVAFFVLAPMAAALFKDAGIPRRLMPGAIALGAISFTMSALPGTPAIWPSSPRPPTSCCAGGARRLLHPNRRRQLHLVRDRRDLSAFHLPAGDRKEVTKARRSAMRGSMRRSSR